jgi:hypothetical protein
LSALAAARRSRAAVFGWPFTSMIPVIGQDSLHLAPCGIGILASLR